MGKIRISCKIEFFKKLLVLLVYCYISGIILYFSDIEKIKINRLDIIKSHELFNLLFSAIADSLAFIPLIFYRRMAKLFIRDKKIPENHDRNELIYNKVMVKFNSKNNSFLMLFSYILEFLERSLILIYLFVLEDEKVYDIKFIWIFSFDYVFRCIFSFMLKKLKINDYLIPNIYIFNSLLLLINGFISLYIYLYDRNQNLQIFHLILIFSKILINTIIDNLNYNLFISKYIHPPKLMFGRGLLNFVFFIIFSVVLYFFSDGKKWMFSSLSDLNLITIILSKILYTLSFVIQKLCSLSIIYNTNPILVSFSSLIYYFEPYISMMIMNVLYNKNVQKGQLEVIFEAISGACFLFSFATSIEIIILPCDFLNKDTKFFVSIREMSDNQDIGYDYEGDSQEESADGEELNALG